MIPIQINDLTLALNPFNKAEISKDLDEYIMKYYEHLSLKKSKLELKIMGLNNLKDQQIITNIIHNFYQTKLKKYQKIDKIDDYIRTILLLIGILATLISNQFQALVSELFLIMGWVVIWEIVYDVLFNLIKRKRKTRLCLALSTCKINFD